MSDMVERLHDLVGERPVARCPKCQRVTWDLEDIGCTCFMPQPDKSICEGVFRGT